MSLVVCEQQQQQQQQNAVTQHVNRIGDRMDYDGTNTKEPTEHVNLLEIEKTKLERGISIRESFYLAPHRHIFTVYKMCLSK